MMVGDPSSGKSTWVAKHKQENPDKDYLVISSDQELYEIGLERGLTDENGLVLSTDVFLQYKDLAKERVMSKLDKALAEGRNIILDRTHTARKDRMNVLLHLTPYSYRKKAVIMDTPLEIILKRWQADPKGVRNIDLKKIDSTLRAEPVSREEGFDIISHVTPDAKAKGGIISPSIDAQRFTPGNAAKEHPEWYDVSIFKELIEAEKKQSRYS